MKSWECSIRLAWSNSTVKTLCADMSDLSQQPKVRKQKLHRSCQNKTRYSHGYSAHYTIMVLSQLTNFTMATRRGLPSRNNCKFLSNEYCDYSLMVMPFFVSNWQFVIFIARKQTICHRCTSLPPLGQIGPSQMLCNGLGQQFREILLYDTNNWLRSLLAGIPKHEVCIYGCFVFFV